MPLNLSPGERVIILAPHPDDESLATGGLILRALSMGAAVRVIFGTNGDNNPWPQRWVERRWSIGPSEQERWGAQRKQEAREAIAYLGLSQEAASFLDLPDQGTGKLMWERSEATICRMAEEIAAFQPTLCVIPSQHDLHADHNALHLLWQMAEQRANLATPPRQLHYLVHSRKHNPAPPQIALELTSEERARKYDAILCHQTQMVLSKKRFLAYARPQEYYHLPPPPCAELPGHTIALAEVLEDQLHFILNLPRRRFGATLHLCGETAGENAFRWIAPIPWSTGIVPPRESSRRDPANASVRIRGRRAEVTVPLPPSLRLVRLYAKFQRPTLFLDQTGWRSVPLTSSGASDSAAEALA